MKKAGIFFAVLCIVLASGFSALAMGFEAETVFDSVFVISDGFSMGSGFAVGKTILITNAHVVEQNRTVKVTTYSGKSYTGTVYATDEQLDLAIVTVSDAQFTPLSIGDESNAKIGDDIYTIGAPNSMTYTLTKGVISAKDRIISGQTYIQIDAAINSGNSGGPLLNDAGQVLGINTLKMSNSEGIGMSIPISRAITFMCSHGLYADEKNIMAFSEKEDTTASSEIEAANASTESYSRPINEPSIKTDKKQSILFVSITVGGLLVTALIVLLVYRKNRNRYITSLDPSDRTDFEIDILE